MTLRALALLAVVAATLPAASASQRPTEITNQKKADLKEPIQIGKFYPIAAKPPLIGGAARTTLTNPNPYAVTFRYYSLKEQILIGDTYRVWLRERWLRKLRGPIGAGPKKFTLLPESSVEVLIPFVPEHEKQKVEVMFTHAKDPKIFTAQQIFQRD